MEAIIKIYINFLSLRTTLPLIAFILSNASIDFTNLLFFIAPFIITVLIIWREKTTAIWIGCFIFLISWTLFHMRFSLVWSGHVKHIITFLSAYPKRIILSYLLFYFSICTYYLYKLWVVGEKTIDQIHLLWLFFAVIANVLYLFPLIFSDYSRILKIFFLTLNIIVGIGILPGHQYIVKRYKHT